MLMASPNVRNRSPFTSTQWQELEQQALIFKYIITGTPIPPDLIYSVKRSLESSRLFPHHPVGWGCYEMGFGRKIDPEPGRCRRTDGKKWRCSKEAYPDSKYCERHMHRGRNRSRKPVEVVSSSTSTAPSAAAATTTNTTHQPIPSYNNSRNHSMSNTNNNNINMPSAVASSFPFSPLPSETQQPFSQSYQSSSLNPFFYSQSTSSRSTDSDFPSQDATTHQLFMDSGSYSRDEKDYRNINIHGLREGADERSFFPEASASSVRSYPESSYQQLSMRSSSSYNKPHSNSSSQQFQNMNDNTSSKHEQHCFVLGTDFKSNRTSKEKETGATQRPLHHFFGEWTQKNTDSWLDLSSSSTIPTDE